MNTKLVETSRGGKVLQHNGFVYHFNRADVGKTRKYWRCSKRTECNARCTTNYDTAHHIDIISVSDHLHEVDRSEVKVREVLRDMKRRAMIHPNEPPTSVFREETQNLDDETLIAMPMRNSVLRNINRIQNSSRPANLRSLMELEITVNPESDSVEEKKSENPSNEDQNLPSLPPKNEHIQNSDPFNNLENEFLKTKEKNTEPLNVDTTSVVIGNDLTDSSEVKTNQFKPTKLVNQDENISNIKTSELLVSSAKYCPEYLKPKRPRLSETVLNKEKDLTEPVEKMIIKNYDGNVSNIKTIVVPQSIDPKRTQLSETKLNEKKDAVQLPSMPSNPKIDTIGNSERKTKKRNQKVDNIKITEKYQCEDVVQIPSSTNPLFLVGGNRKMYLTQHNKDPKPSQLSETKLNEKESTMQLPSVASNTQASIEKTGKMILMNQDVNLSSIKTKVVPQYIDPKSTQSSEMNLDEKESAAQPTSISINPKALTGATGNMLLMNNAGNADCIKSTVAPEYLDPKQKQLSETRLNKKENEEQFTPISPNPQNLMGSSGNIFLITHKGNVDSKTTAVHQNIDPKRPQLSEMKLNEKGEAAQLPLIPSTLQALLEKNGNIPLMNHDPNLSIIKTKLGPQYIDPKSTKSSEMKLNEKESSVQPTSISINPQALTGATGNMLSMNNTGNADCIKSTVAPEYLDPKQKQLSETRLNKKEIEEQFTPISSNPQNLMGPSGSIFVITHKGNVDSKTTAVHQNINPKRPQLSEMNMNEKGEAVQLSSIPSTLQVVIGATGGMVLKNRDGNIGSDKTTMVPQYIDPKQTQPSETMLSEKGGVVQLTSIPSNPQNLIGPSGGIFLINHEGNVGCFKTTVVPQYLDSKQPQLSEIKLNEKGEAVQLPSIPSTLQASTGNILLKNRDGNFVNIKTAVISQNISSQQSQVSETKFNEKRDPVQLTSTPSNPQTFIGMTGNMVLKNYENFGGIKTVVSQNKDPKQTQLSETKFNEKRDPVQLFSLLSNPPKLVGASGSIASIIRDENVDNFKTTVMPQNINPERKQVSKTNLNKIGDDVQPTTIPLNPQYLTGLTKNITLMNRDGNIDSIKTAKMAISNVQCCRENIEPKQTLIFETTMKEKGGLKTTTSTPLNPRGKIGSRKKRILKNHDRNVDSTKTTTIPQNMNPKRTRLSKKEANKQKGAVQCTSVPLNSQDLIESSEKGVLVNHDGNDGSIQITEVPIPNFQYCEENIQPKQTQLSKTMQNENEDPLQITSNPSKSQVISSKTSSTKNSEKCRLCLKTRKTMTTFNSFVKGNEGITTVEFLNMFLALKILDSENTSKLICNVCFKKLETSYKFHQQCLKSEEYWKEQSGNEQITNFSFDSADESNHSTEEDPLKIVSDHQITIKTEIKSESEISSVNEINSVGEINSVSESKVDNVINFDEIKQEVEENNDDRSEFQNIVQEDVNDKANICSNIEPISSNLVLQDSVSELKVFNETVIDEVGIKQEPEENYDDNSEVQNIIQDLSFSNFILKDSTIESKVYSEISIDEGCFKQESVENNYKSSELQNKVQEDLNKTKNNNGSNIESISSDLLLKQNDEITCLLCKIQFSEDEVFWDHVKEIHLDSSTIQIIPCRQNLQTNHSDEVYFYCKKCLLYSRTENNLQSHLQIHSEDCHSECSFCEKTFKNGEIFYRHLKEHFDRL